MESTALALYAIRKAAEAGLLPEATVHPTVNNKVLLPPERTSAILARAATAIAARQNKDGMWSAGKIHEKSSVFSAVAVAPPFETGLFKLASPTNCLTTAQGYAALLDAGRAAGFDKLQSRFAENVDLGRRAQIAAATGYLTNAEAIVVPIKGNLAPEQLISQFARVHCPGGGIEEQRRDLWLLLARRTLGLQSTDGSWGDGVVMLDSDSGWDYMDNWARMWIEKHRDAAKQPAYDSQNYWNNIGGARRVDARLACTSWAMLFLLDGVRPPVGGFPAARAGSAAAGVYLSKAVEFVQKEAHLATRLVPLTPSTAALADALPLLVLTSSDPLSAPGTKSALERILANGGTAVFISTTNATAAESAALLAFVPNGKVAPIPESAAFLATYRGKTKPALQGIQREDGRLAVLLLPVAPAGDGKKAEGRLTQPEAVLTLAALIEEHAVRTGLCTRGFPAKMAELADPFTERVRLLNSLGSHGAGLAPDETW